MQTLYGSELYDKIMSGAEEVYKSVSSTFGPLGRNVILKKDNQQIITKDGVTVAKFISFKDDPFKDIGCSILKESSMNTNMLAGDGTTTSVILAYNILKLSKIMLDNNDKINVRTLIEQIKKVADIVVEELSKKSKKISTIEEIKSIATISANNDPEIGQLIAEAVESIGMNGFISIQEAKSNKSSVLIKEGFKFDSGFETKLLCNSPEGSRPKVTYSNPLFLITDIPINAETNDEMMNILNLAHQTQRPLIIVADEVSGPPLSSLILNFQREVIRVAIVNPPYYGERKIEFLEDLAIATGGTFISKDKRQTDLNSGFKSQPKLLPFSVTDFGSADYIEVTKFETSIVDPHSDEEKLNNRIQYLEELIRETDNIEICKVLQERVSRLQSGFATILVGGETETGMRERKFRVEDSLEAVNSAIQDGILPGGCIGLLNACASIPRSDEYEYGKQVVSAAVTELFMKLCDNSNVDWESIFDIIDANDDNDNFGYDFLNKEFGDMLEKGIIDPAKVTKTSLLNAISSISILLTANAALVEGE